MRRGGGKDAGVTVSPPPLRAPRHQVSPRARWYWGLRALAGWMALIAVVVVVLLGGHHSAGVRYGIVGGCLLLALLHIAVMPQWRFRVHRWEDTGGAVYTQTGWFTQERRIAPVNRIQTVDTERGPIEQLFRLSNVTITTASAAGPLKIHGLDRATADRLVEELTVHTQATSGDAT
jgi:uncharacterized protein